VFTGDVIGHEGIGMVTLTETAAALPLSPAITIGARVSNVLPLIGLGFALTVNAVWIAFLSYCFWKLI
jgi:hypothetical protein